MVTLARTVTVRSPIMSVSWIVALPEAVLEVVVAVKGVPGEPGADPPQARPVALFWLALITA